ncbi:MAG: hypothetical protein AAGA30_06380 [Planctomycetota bacterium]
MNNSPSSTESRFLILGVLWGILVGYLVAEFGTGSNGYLLILGSYRSHKNFVTACVLIFPALGLLTGLLLDIFVAQPQRQLVANYLSRSLIWAAALSLFILFIVLAPSVQRVR